VKDLVSNFIKPGFYAKIRNFSTKVATFRGSKKGPKSFLDVRKITIKSVACFIRVKN
jgi:hypothetical protein